MLSSRLPVHPGADILCATVLHRSLSDELKMYHNALIYLAAIHLVGVWTRILRKHTKLSKLLLSFQGGMYDSSPGCFLSPGAASGMIFWTIIILYFVGVLVLNIIDIKRRKCFPIFSVTQMHHDWLVNGASQVTDSDSIRSTRNSLRSAPNELVPSR